MGNRKNSGVCEEKTFPKSCKGPKEEKNDALLKAHFCSYVQKTITLTALQLKKAKAEKRSKENLSLNVVDPEFKEERVNLVAADAVDFLKEIELGEGADNLSELTENKKIIDAFLGLTKKQRTIFYHCILLGERDLDVAVRLGITKQAVNKTKRGAIKKIREAMPDDYATSHNIRRNHE